MTTRTTAKRQAITNAATAAAASAAAASAPGTATPTSPASPTPSAIEGILESEYNKYSISPSSIEEIDRRALNWITQRYEPMTPSSGA